MATTTENPATSLANANAAPAVVARSRVAGLVLMFVVFIGGASVMTVEMSASRLLAPYFGTSLFIWANLIGLVMVYLALGYWLGGKLADRYPRASLLYTITAVAALAVAFIPMLSRPILSWSLSGFSQVSLGIFYSSLVGVILLFSVPLLLLGFVSPFAIRLRSVGQASAGGTAGQVSALSTLGSILGTLFPTFFLIPYIGTTATLYSASVVLMVFSIIGLLSTSNTRQAMISAVMLLVVLGLAAFAPRGLVKPPERGELVYEKESAYNYIQVVREGKRLGLMLNEGRAIHSIYNPDELLTGGPWDYWAIAPYFSQGFEQDDYKSMAMIGSAAGTASHIITEAYGPIPMDGVEIDPEIVEVGRRYFALDTLPNVTTHVEDGRTYLQTGGRDKKWTVIGIDAYRQPYIPFHLTTVEFFQEVKDHLTPDGAVMINAGRTLHDTRLVDALANTMLQVYPNVYVIDVPTMANSMIIGTASPSRYENFAENASRVDQPVLKQIFDVSQQKGNIREVEPDAAKLVFTDDKAPIEEVINQIILGYVEEAGR
ncbi:MAG TPA: fused MFS/spermidine synthase [Chloroflexia bacterium]